MFNEMYILTLVLSNATINISTNTAFELSHMVDPSTAQCLLPFLVAFCQSKDLFKVKHFINTKPKVCLLKYLILPVNAKANHNLFVVLVEMFIVVLHNTKINIYISLNTPS